MIEHIAELEEIKDLSEWYKISSKTIINRGGFSAIGCYGGSISACLAALYPQNSWKPWLFVNPPKNFWHKIEHQHQFLISVKEKLNITTASGWYNTRVSELMSLGATPILTRYWPYALQHVHTEFNWEWHKFLSHRGRQKFMIQCLGEVFPGSKLELSKFRTRHVALTGSLTMP
mmetsp:Transcript_30886/g.34441  ORF Transcript_30886/g.34441 Transcript_30886/m.34441 type:complete len:174 (-) Transcript_30886:159-680(-)